MLSPSRPLSHGVFADVVVDNYIGFVNNNDNNLVVHLQLNIKNTKAISFPKKNIDNYSSKFAIVSKLHIEQIYNIIMQHSRVIYVLNIVFMWTKQREKL